MISTFSLDLMGDLWNRHSRTWPYATAYIKRTFDHSRRSHSWRRYRSHLRSAFTPSDRRWSRSYEDIRNYRQTGHSGYRGRWWYWRLKTYHRTLEQNIALGLVAPSDDALRISAISEDLQNIPFSEDEIFVFPGICSSCAHPIQTRMKKNNIPYFKVSMIFV